MKITLQIKGQEMTFSEEELIDILEEHFKSKSEEKVRAIKAEQEMMEKKVYEVNYKLINKELFSKEKKDKKQEKVRRLILEAFEEVEQNPDKYEKIFYTLKPQNTWYPHYKLVKHLESFAILCGDHVADWVEQALEWAQRISNGESWETMCNEEDSSKWSRLIIWKNGYARIVGGSSLFNVKLTASEIHNVDYQFDDELCSAVPLVVYYK